MEILGKNGATIWALEDWRRLTPPKGRDKHWVPGRSALEVAKAWCGEDGPCVPTEVATLLRSHPDFRNVTLERAFPERQIPFDELPGEPRNADLAIAARDEHGVIAITVEGKADESFDRPVRLVLAAAARRIAEDQATRAIDRVESLSAAILPRWREGFAHLGVLRYQLLTAVAGSLAWARELSAERAVLVVHEFVTERTSDTRHAQNAADLDRFVHRLTEGAHASLAKGALIGPIMVHGNARLPRVPLDIGRAERNIRPVT